MAMAVEVEIKATHMIKASEKTWTGTMKLSEIDIGFEKVLQRKLYLYKNNDKGKWDPTSINHTLKDSLGKVLVHFYPLTGRLIFTDTGDNSVMELHVASTEAVPFLEAEADADLSDLGDDFLEADIQGRLKNLFCPMHDPNKPLQDLPLMTTQATHFRCGGVVVATTFSHVLLDGVGAGHFYTEWTRFARGEPLRITPIHDRTLLRRVGESIPKFIRQRADQPPSPQTTTIKQEADQPPLLQRNTTVKLRLSKSEIDKLKQTIGNITNVHRPYTSFEILTAHAWRCLSKVRENEDKKESTVGIIVDIRKRLNPPLPREYNGNVVILRQVVSEIEDLISNPIVYICDKIREAIDKVNNDVIWEFLDYQKSLKGKYVKSDVMMVYWRNLPYNNLDFGWGNESYMTCATPSTVEGRVIVQAGYHKEDWAIISVGLQVAHVDKFKYHFFHPLREGVTYISLAVQITHS